jgi:hypothetical protein
MLRAQDAGLKDETTGEEYVVASSAFDLLHKKVGRCRGQRVAMEPTASGIRMFPADGRFNLTRFAWSRQIAHPARPGGFIYVTHDQTEAMTI